MMFSINVDTDLEGTDLDNLRDILATVVENALTSVPGARVGTTTAPAEAPDEKRRRILAHHEAVRQEFLRGKAL